MSKTKIILCALTLFYFLFLQKWTNTKASAGEALTNTECKPLGSCKFWNVIFPQLCEVLFIFQNYFSLCCPCWVISVSLCSLSATLEQFKSNIAYMIHALVSWWFKLRAHVKPQAKTLSFRPTDRLSGRNPTVIHFLSLTHIYQTEPNG